MSDAKLMAVDFGASGGKVFSGIFEKDTFHMDELHRFEHGGIPFFLSDREGVVSERTYWDDAWLYENTLRGLRRFRRDVGKKLDSIGFDTWGSDGQFVTADGDLLGRVYCYRDHRLDNMIDELKKLIDPVRVYEITGIHFQPFNISNQMLWFMRNRAGFLPPGATFIPMPSLFYYYMGNVRMVDSCWASVTQLMDAHEKRWSSELLRAIGLPQRVMPEIVEPGSVVGEMSEQLADSLRLNRARLVSVGSHDTASAFAAAPVEEEEHALIISSGTWSLVGKLIPKPITNTDAMDFNISNEGGIGNVRFLKNCMGTWIVQELRRLWKQRDGKQMQWDEITGLVEKADAFTSFVDPDDAGFYNPADMEQAISQFCKKTKQRVPRDRAAFLRVVYESLALKYRLVDEQISGVCGSSSKVVNIVGGGCRNELLNHFTADATGLPVVAGPEEATAVGNIAVQTMGIGLFTDLASALSVMLPAFSIKRYEPERPEIWNAQYGRFRKLLEGIRC
jgi:sugar (pentulose or hexulose) kinase